jgi:hypothetical protein
MSIQHSKLVLKWVSPPVWDVCLQLLLIFFIKSSPVQIKSCKSSELISSFIPGNPISLNLWLQSNWGWNRDYRTKLGFKERVTLRRTLWMVISKKGTEFPDHNWRNRNVSGFMVYEELQSWLLLRNCKGQCCQKERWYMNQKLVTYLQRMTNEVFVYIQSLHACGGSLSGVR